MGNLKDMMVYKAVVEAGSFAGAAKKCELTPAMVGRRVAAIEQELGFMLLNRSTRQMQVTPGGQDYYEGCKNILEQVEELEESLTSAHQTNPKGLIRLSAPDGLGSPFLVEVIKAFRMQYPDIRFDLNLTNKSLDLIEQKIDLSFRLMYELEDSSLVATKVGHTAFGLYASQDYLDRKGYPTDLNALKEHDCINMGSSRSGSYWQTIIDGNLVNFRQPWALTVANTDTLIHSVADGVGISVIPSLFAETHKESEKLVQLHDVITSPELDIYVLYPTRKHLPYRVTVFLDFIKAWVGDKLTT